MLKELKRNTELQPFKEIVRFICNRHNIIILFKGKKENQNLLAVEIKFAVQLNGMFIICTLVSGQPSYRVHHLDASNWQFESLSALTFVKVVFQVYYYNLEPCSSCDFAMSSGERDPLNLGLPYLICLVSVCCNISEEAGQNLI